MSITGLTLNFGGDQGYAIEYAGTKLFIAVEELIPTSFAWENSLFDLDVSLDEVSFKIVWMMQDPVIGSVTEFKLDVGDNRKYLEKLVHYANNLETYMYDGADIEVNLDD